MAQLGAGVIFADGASATSSCTVSDEAELIAAIDSCNVIELSGNITLAGQSILIKDKAGIVINGNGNSLISSSFPNDWISNGDNYTLKIWNSSNITLENIIISTNSQAGILVSGSTAKFNAPVSVSGKLGGVEVEKNSTLDINGLLGYTGEDDKPALWAIGANTLNGEDLPEYYTKYIKSDEGHTEYFTNLSAIPGAVAVNQAGEVFDSLQVAINSSDSTTIDLLTDMTVSSPISITKPLTLNGNNGHTITSNLVGEIKPRNNSALEIVGTTGVNVDRLTVQNGANQEKVHGILVYNAKNVKLTNIVAQNNNASGVNIGQGAEAIIENITTRNNSWHGINVDKAGATLTIGGNNLHEDNIAIVVGDTTPESSTLTDRDGQYEAYETEDGAIAYRAKTEATDPVVPIIPEEIPTPEEEEDSVIALDPISTFTSFAIVPTGPTYAEEISTDENEKTVETKQAENTEESDQDEESSNKLFGLAWYWWIAIPVALVGVWWLVVVLRRKQD